MASGTIPIIDCDIHPSDSPALPLLPHIPKAYHEAIRSGMAANRGAGYSNPFGVIRRDADCTDPRQTARDHLDRYNITYGVLQPPGLKVSLTNNIDVGNALATAWNDWQIAHWLPADERYLGSICVNMNDPAAAARELRRAAGAHPRMKQLNIPGESTDLYGHRRYFPVYEACAEAGLPICLHPGAEGSLASSTPVGRPSSYFEWHTGLSLTFMAQLISLVAEGVFERFPTLKLILCEGGVSWLSHLMWRMDKNFKALRSTTPWLRRLPSEYIVDHVRVTTQPMEEPETDAQFLNMLGMIHAEKTLCFATDFPHWDFDAPSAVLPKKVPEDLKRRILFDNAAELYGLKAPVMAEAAAS